VIVATRVWRFFLVQIFLILGFSCSVQAMVWDNRYFPWFDQLYNASDSRHGYFDINAFFVVDRDAFRFEHRAAKGDQVVSLPELWGLLRLDDVGNAMTLAGLQNPIPQDWQWYSEFDAAMPSSLDGQGVAVACYAPIGKHFGIGANTFIMKVSSFVSVVPSPTAVSKLNLSTPGNQALFTQMMAEMYQELGITSTSYQEVGVGDVVVYGCIHDTHEYKYKFRKLDWGSYFGVIIPTGTQQSPYNLASVPLGGGYGMWGWFVAPFAEFELKDDLKFGFELRLTQRLDRCFTGRIPVANEQLLFAPVVGSIGIDSGVTVSFAPYFVFEDLRAGFGAQAKYTITVHEHDMFSAKFTDSDLTAHLKTASFYSGFTQEYFTIRLFYDVAHDKNWQKRPLCYLSWDVPMNHIAGRGFAKTNRVSLGCTVNF
jgi:hypothetical protein